MGNPHLAKTAKRGTAAVKANARRFAANVLPIIEEIERSGVTSHNAIAAKLNERNVRTAPKLASVRAPKFSGRRPAEFGSTKMRLTQADSAL